MRHCRRSCHDRLIRGSTEAGRAASVPAAVRHDQRRAPVRLPVAGLGLRPARRARAAARGGGRLETGHETVENVRRPRRPGDRPGHARRPEVLRPAAEEERLRAGAAPLAAGRPHDAGARGAEGDRRAAASRGTTPTTTWLRRDAVEAVREGDPPRVKPLLYVYRVLLTGIHLMRTGEVEANLVTLNEEFRLPLHPRTDRPQTGRAGAVDAGRRGLRLSRVGVRAAARRTAGGARNEPIAGIAGCEARPALN